MKTVQIITGREIGLYCHSIAPKYIPEGWRLLPNTNAPDPEADVIISVLYPKVITSFERDKRYYNFHPGILPEYAGSATIAWTILNNEDFGGVSLHEIVREVDGGDVLGIGRYPILPTDTAQDLGRKFSETVVWMFITWIRRLCTNEELEVVVQDKTKRRNYKRKELDEMKDLTRVVRALTFAGKEHAYFYTRDGRRIELSYDKGIL